MKHQANIHKVSSFVSKAVMVWILFFTVVKISNAGEQTVSKTSQGDWKQGKYEFSEIDINTDPSQGNVQLQLDLGTWDASGPANINHPIGNPPSNPNYGNSKVVKAGRFLYTFRNGGFGQFLRYDMDTREWKEMAYVPIQVYEALDATTDGSTKIWAFATRSNRKHFLQYDIATDTWSFLTNTPNVLTQGATLEYVPGPTSYIYAFRGGSTDFWRYHLNGAQVGIWETIPNPTSPYGAATCGTYCDLVYDGSRYLFLISDSANPDRIYKYDTWSFGSAWPYTSMASNGLVGLGSDLVKVGTNYYMLQTPLNGGVAAKKMYKYNGTTWSTVTDPPYAIIYGSLEYDTESGKIIALTDIGNLMYYNPADAKWSYTLNSPPANTYHGNNLMTTNGTTQIYQCRGQNTATCYTYTIASNTWSSAITYSTGNLADGSVMAYMNGLNYVGRGGSTAFYSVTPSTGAITTLAATSANFNVGSAIVASGSANLFVLHGGSTTFRKYNTSTGWSNLTAFPEASGRGGGLAKVGDFIYGTPGGNRGRFYRYAETGNQWTEMASIPVAVYNGGALTSDGTRYIYLQAGGDNDYNGRYFYRYDTQTNVWQRMADTPNMIRYGGGLTYVGGKVYSYQGFNNAFWSYTPPTGTKTYVSSGTWYSPVYDMQYASSFVSFSSSYTPAAGVSDSVVFYSRTSENQNIWTSWEPTDTNIISPALSRYIQFKAVLTGKADGSVTPSIDSFSFTYIDDTTVPDTSGLHLKGYSNSIKTTQLTNGQTYNYRNPYFEWDAATDTETGVEGYYVYFGDQDGYDPITYGSFQQNRTYTVSSGLVSGTTYYLKIKAKNKAGYSSSAESFSFVYEGISPVTTATISSQVDWDSPEASRSSVYSSSASWWNQSYAYRQQLSINPSATATAGSMIRVTIDTDALVVANKLRSDRKDWRIIYFNGVNYEEVDRQYVNSTTTFFPLRRSVNVGTTNTDYYVYYGNEDETSTPRESIADSYAAAKWGVAASFDGGDYIRIPTMHTALNGLSAVTIEGWFKYLNTNGIRSLYGGDATQQTAINIPSGNNILQYQLRTTASGTVYSNNGLNFLVPNTWNHFALVYDSATGTARGFLNGRLDFIRTGLSGTLVASATQRIGSNNTNGGLMYGFVDEYRLSNTARYTANFSLQTEPFSTDGNTLGLYHFDEGSAQTLIDSSAGGRNGEFGSGSGVDVADPLWMGFVTASSGVEMGVPASANTSLMLQYASNGTWMGNKLASLPWGARMQYGAATVAGNALYVIKGNNTMTFYKLDLITNVWTQLTDLPAAAYYGSAMAFDGNDNIYIVRGNGSTDFYKYTISTNSFITSPTLNQPVGAFSYGAAMTKGKDNAGNDVLYLIRGGNATELYTFFLSGAAAGTWSQKTSAPFATYYGSGLAYDVGENSVWMLAGNGSGFAKYSIADDVWDTTITAPALAPYTIAYASNNMFLYGNYLYTFTSVDIQSNNERKNYVWRYNKAADMWEDVTMTTEFWAYTGAVAYDGLRYAYLINGDGSGQTAFARFDVQTHTYSPDNSILPQDRLYTNNGERIVHGVSTGTSLAFDGSDTVYMAQGGTSYINKYTISAKQWTQLPNVPCLYYGNIVYAQSSLYVICGNNSKKLYRYDEGYGQWKELADAPDLISNAGNQAAVYDGTSAIYVVRGYNTTHLYKYTIAANDTGAWTTESTTIPGTVGTAGGGNSLGASIQYYADGTNEYLYIFRGNGTANLYRYKLNAPTGWTTLSLVPDQIYQGSGSVLHNGKIFISTGFHNTQMYIYDIASDTYAYAPNAPSHISAGGAMTKGAGNTVYAVQGNGMYTFWKYILPSSTTAFTTSGTFISNPIPINGGYSFAGLSATVASPSATSVLFETRSSQNLEDWTEWSLASNKKILPSNEEQYTISSPVERYIQIRATLNSDDGVSSPTISSISVMYYADSTPPVNPSVLRSFSSVSAASGSADLVADTWKNYSSPYFDWSGATDGTGSGIAGYYVYFGPNASADATVSGQLISIASYSATLTTDGEYYMKVKTVDNAGNISPLHWSPFHYLYDGTPPTTIASENVSVMPNGYTATNYFTFTWLTTDDPLSNATASGLLRYEYKTGTPSGSLSSYQPYGGTCTGGQCTIAGITAYQENINTFYLRALDVAGNISSVTTSTYSYNTMAPGPPRNLAVDTSQAAANKFSFTWDDPLASTFRGTIKEYRYSINEPPNEANVSTTSAKVVNNIKGTHDGENTFYVVAVDDADNVSYLHYASKKFTVAVTAPGIPLAPEGFDNSIRATQQYRVGLTWDAPTDKGTSFDRYDVYASETDVECSTDMSSYELAGSTAGTSYVVTSIGETALESKEYFFCIVACATTNQCSSPSTTISQTPTGRWLTAPDLVGTSSATVKTKTAVIQWSTSRAANSFVKYGTKSGDYGNEVGSSEQVTAHEIDLTELTPGTTYYYKMIWTDEDGNLGSSDERTFVTNAAPVISNVKFSHVNITSAQVTFTVANAIKATLQYGKTISYGSTTSISTSKSESAYTVELDSLAEGTIHHLRIAAEDDEGNIYYSDDYTFETLPTPKLSGIRVQQVIGMPTATVRLLWSSNTLTSSIVTYFPTASPQKAVDSISLALKKTHEVIVKDLLDETDYTIIIKGKDSAGNEAKSETRTLKTATDVRAPLLENVNVETTIIGVGDAARAQIVVTWDTDEPATTQVEYGQGTGTTYNQTTQEDTNLTSNHSVTITGLSPAKIYHLRAISKDKVGNAGQSLDTVVITPKSTKDALNLVIENLSKTFGFIRGISGSK